MKMMKKVVSVALVGAMMMSVAACGKNYTVVSKKDFTNALEDVADLDEDDWYDYEDYYSHSKHDIDCYDGDFHYEWIEFDNEDHAMDFFEDYYYDDFEDMIDDKDFDGKYSTKITDTEGYIILNGESNSSDFFDDELYGGIFCKDGVVVIVLCRSTRDRDTSRVDEFLRAIGYPTP